MSTHTPEVKPKNPVTRLSLYLGYGEAGRALLARIKALAAKNNKKVRHLVLDALKATYGEI